MAMAGLQLQLRVRHGGGGGGGPCGRAAGRAAALPRPSGRSAPGFGHRRRPCTAASGGAVHRHVSGLRLRPRPPAAGARVRAPRRGGSSLPAAGGARFAPDAPPGARHRQPGAGEDQAPRKVDASPSGKVGSLTLVFACFMIYYAERPDEQPDPHFIWLIVPCALAVVFSLLSLVLSYLSVYVYDECPGLDHCCCM
ncbi:hypothetical protein ACP4OV_012166 [Aristida adscensionis]